MEGAHMGVSRRLMKQSSIVPELLSWKTTKLVPYFIRSTHVASNVEQSNDSKQPSTLINTNYNTEDQLQRRHNTLALRKISLDRLFVTYDMNLIKYGILKT